jgi:hypothetical protein
MPGLTRAQSNPSRLPLPLQCVPQETSFSPVTLTHFLLTHWVSSEQKQPPGLVHTDEVPLQCPMLQENAVATELGHPPSGHSTLPSATLLAVQWPLTQFCPARQA